MPKTKMGRTLVASYQGISEIFERAYARREAQKAIDKAIKELNKDTEMKQTLKDLEKVIKDNA